MMMVMNNNRYSCRYFANGEDVSMIWKANRKGEQSSQLDEKSDRNCNESLFLVSNDNSNESFFQTNNE